MIRLTLVSLLVTAALPAQEEYPRHNLRVGFGASIPRATAQYFRTSPALAAGYGWRFQRYLQAGAGVDVFFGPSQTMVDQARQSFPDLGSLKVRDRQLAVQLGLRGILPIRRDRLQIFLGGGLAWLDYSRRQSGSDILLDTLCAFCWPRSGAGYYLTGGSSVALDRREHYRAGVAVRFYRARTEPDNPTLSFPNLEDEWLAVVAEFWFGR